MITQHHFVVIAERNEDGTVSLYHDSATTEARFPEGPVWDTENQEWHLPDNEDEIRADDSLRVVLENALKEGSG